MSILRRDDVRSLYGSFSDAYRAYRDTFKNGRPLNRNKPKGYDLLKGVSDDELAKAIREAVSICSGETKKSKLTSIMRAYLGSISYQKEIEDTDRALEAIDEDLEENARKDEDKERKLLIENRKLIDKRSILSPNPNDHISLKTVQNLFSKPSEMSIHSYELLLTWLEEESSNSVIRLYEAERPQGGINPDGARDDISEEDQIDINREREKLSAYRNLKQLLITRPEREPFEREVKKEYSARALIEAINVLGDEDRRYLLKTLTLLLERFVFQYESSCVSERQPVFDSAKDRDVVAAKNLVLNLLRTDCGREAEEDDLCQLIATPNKISYLMFKLFFPESSIEIPTDANTTSDIRSDFSFDEDVEQAALSSRYDPKGLSTGVEWNPVTVTLLDVYTGTQNRQ